MSDLNKWVKEHKKEIKLVMKHGRTKTVRQQAEALLEASDIDLEDLEADQ
ncbi:MAG: hypothetical protein ACOCSL_00610 [Thermoplasmatota archaeon]